MLSSDASVETALTRIEQRLAELLVQNEQLRKERDEYKRLYMEMAERCRKLELGILGPKREKFSVADGQLTLSIIAALAGTPENETANDKEKEKNNDKDNGGGEQGSKPEKPRPKPTGRKLLPEALPRVDIVVLPVEVEQKGREAFVQIGEDVCETVEYRPSSLVVVRTHKPKFVAKEKENTEATVLQAKPLELPIDRGLAGPGLLAQTIVQRWQDHLPLHRLERVYGRLGYELARSTVCSWHIELSKLVKPLLDAMWADAMSAPYLCTDATGVLVQAKNECKRAHFFVVAAPEKHVLFGYTKKHDKKAVDKLLLGYKGYLVADAHSVYDHLYKNAEIIEVACWAHLRRYLFKALSSDPDRARHALALIQGLFAVERKHATSTPENRLKIRQAESLPMVEGFFAWCEREASSVLDETPIAKAIGYALNHQVAFRTFLKDGRLPLHNNFSERELRREALGRKNWLFLGSDDGGEANAAFVSLLASCQLHNIEPTAYLRDLLCLLPRWPVKDVLSLSPASWKKTLEHSDTQKLLAANVFRSVCLGLDPHP